MIEAYDALSSEWEDPAAFLKRYLWPQGHVASESEFPRLHFGLVHPRIGDNVWPLPYVRLDRSDRW